MQTHLHISAVPLMMSVLNAPLPAPPTVPKFSSVFCHDFKILSKLATKLFPWKLTSLKHHDKGRSRSQAQSTTIVMFVQQSEITDFI